MKAMILSALRNCYSFNKIVVLFSVLLHILNVPSYKAQLMIYSPVWKVTYNSLALFPLLDTHTYTMFNVCIVYLNYFKNCYFFIIMHF